MGNEKTQFKPGESGNPNGRPVGSKHKLSDEFVQALCADFALHGVAAIDALREKSPGEYLRVIASILPKDIYIEQDIRPTVINAQPELTTEEWEKKHSPRKH